MLAGRRPAFGVAGGAAARDRSLETIEQIYREHAPRFRRVALAIVRNPETADDVVQDAFARAVARRSSFRKTGAEAGWIWRAVVNGALSRSRRGRLESRTLARAELHASDVALPTTPDERIRREVARLPERQRLALFLRYYADLDYGAIAEVLAIAPGTVGKLLHDARARIREALEGEGRG